MPQVSGEDELEEALTKNENGESRGADKVTVESLKYGGTALREEVFRIVKLMRARPRPQTRGKKHRSGQRNGASRCRSRCGKKR